LVDRLVLPDEHAVKSRADVAGLADKVIDALASLGGLG
jgi:hypothetical protein